MSRSTDTRLYLAGATLWLLAGVAVFTLDGPFARYDAGGVPGDLLRLVQLSEVFAHGMGVGMILIAMWVLDPHRRLHVPRVAGLAYLAGLTANVCKLLVTRQRPKAFDLSEAVVSSFRGIPGNAGSSELQSFPSGHAATAFGLAFALSLTYPRGRYLFALLAVLAASQRVLSGAHFLSDTLAGAGIACFVAAVLRERLFWDARVSVHG